MDFISSRKTCMPPVLYRELSNRYKGAPDIIRFNNPGVKLPESRDQWFEELSYVKLLQREHNFEPL